MIRNFRLSKAIIPNTFTAFNIFSGFLSIVFASSGDIILASVMIFIAAIFDSLDGLMARLTKSSSQFGVELDSIADVVSFGAAPSFLIFKSFLYQFGFAGIILSSLPLLAGAFRLARFNVQLEDYSIKIDFKGLPIPYQAITLATFVINFYPENVLVNDMLYLLIFLVVVLSFLMVSNIRYPKMPNVKKMPVARKFLFIATVIILIVVSILSEAHALFYIFISGIFLGIFWHVFSKIFPGVGNKKLSKQIN